MSKQLRLFEDEKANEKLANAKKPLRTGGAFDAIVEEYRWLYDTFREEDLYSEDLKLIADILGPEAAFVLVLKLGGVQLSIPKRGLNRAIQRYIRENFTGGNVRQLAVKCGVTAGFVYSCISKNT